MSPMSSVRMERGSEGEGASLWGDGGHALSVRPTAAPEAAGSRAAASPQGSRLLLPAGSEQGTPAALEAALLETLALCVLLRPLAMSRPPTATLP